MVADFLPPSAVEIRDPAAIALLQRLQRRVIQIPFEQGTPAAQLFVEITTAYVRDALVQLVAQSAGIPILTRI